jgi:hypothetical protein
MQPMSASNGVITTLIRVLKHHCALIDIFRYYDTNATHNSKEISRLRYQKPPLWKTPVKLSRSTKIIERDAGQSLSPVEQAARERFSITGMRVVLDVNSGPTGIARRPAAREALLLPKTATIPRKLIENCG